MTVIPFLPKATTSSTFRKFTGKLNEVFAERVDSLSGSERDRVHALLPSIISHLGFPGRAQPSDVLHLDTLSLNTVEWLWVTLFIGPIRLLRESIEDLVACGMIHTSELYDLDMEEFERLDHILKELIDALSKRQKALRQ
jgi:hypothetical protein